VNCDDRDTILELLWAQQRGDERVRCALQTCRPVFKWGKYTGNHSYDEYIDENILPQNDDGYIPPILRIDRDGDEEEEDDDSIEEKEIDDDDDECAFPDSQTEKGKNTYLYVIDIIYGRMSCASDMVFEFHIRDR